MRSVGDIALDAEVRAIASGAITDGAPVVVNADGTVTKVSEVSQSASVGTAVVYESAAIGSVEGGISFDTTNNRIIIVYPDSGNSDYGTAVVGTVSGTGISFGTPVVFVSVATSQMTQAFDTNAGKVAIIYRQSDTGRAIVGTVDSSDNSISFGSSMEWNSTYCNYQYATFDSTNNKILAVFSDYTSGTNGMAIVGTISGTDITFGSKATFYSGTLYNQMIQFDPSQNKSLITYRKSSDNKPYVRVGDSSSGSFSFGTEVNVNNAATGGFCSVYHADEQKMVIFYSSASDLDAKVATISGTDVTLGSAVSIDTGNVGDSRAFYDPDAQKIAVVFREDSTTSMELKLCTLSGSTLALSGYTDSGAGTVLDSDDGYYFDVVYDTNENTGVVSFLDYGNSSYGTAVAFKNAFTSTPITSENFIGFANATYADGQKATVKTTGSIARNITQVASVPTPTDRTIIEEVSSNYLFRSTTISLGSGKFVILYTIYLGSGEPVVYYKVGTIDQATNTVSYSDRTSTDAFTAYSLSGILDTNANRIVVAYENATDGKGYAAVGTVSGNTISFGTPVVFEDAVAKEINLTFDSTANKVIISWRDQNNSNYGTAIVATVDNSDNSISFGTAVVYESAYTITYPPNAITYDSNSNRVVIVYRDVGDSNKGKAIVGTVSGTSISFGTAVDVDTGNSTDYLTAVFNPDVNKVLITYDASDKRGKSKIGTVSGTSISLTGVTTFNDDTNNDGTIYQSSCYDTTSNTHLIVYRDNTLSGASTNHVYGIIGTMNGDGSAISYGTEFAIDLNAVINPGGNQDGNGWKTQCIYDSTTERFIVTYDFDVLKKLATSMVIPIGGELGITPAQTYYVQTDGTLSQTADSPSVTAGTAVASSTLIVKG